MPLTAEAGKESLARSSPRSEKRSVVSAAVTAGFALLFAIVFFPVIERMRPEEHFMCSYGGKKLETFIVGGGFAALAAVVLLVAIAAARTRGMRWSASHFAWTIAPSLWMGIAASVLFLARTTTWSLTLGPMCGF